MKRCALYEVETMTQAPKGDPFMVAIGDVEYRQKYERKGPLSIVKAKFDKGGHASGFESKSIKENEKKGTHRCEPLGERKIGSEAAVGRQIRNSYGEEPDRSATDMWISRATAMPFFKSIGPDDGGGFPWVYGNSALPPVPGASQ